MRKFIGTLTIIVVLYVGLFGYEKYNIKPFIVEWFKSDSSKEVKEKAVKIKDVIFEKGEKVVKEKTDTIINRLTDSIN